MVGLCVAWITHSVTFISMGSGTFVTVQVPLLLVIVTTALLLVDSMAVGDGSSAGVCSSPEAQRMPHVSRWAAVHFLVVFV